MSHQIDRTASNLPARFRSLSRVPAAVLALWLVAVVLIIWPAVAQVCGHAPTLLVFAVCQLAAALNALCARVILVLFHYASPLRRQWAVISNWVGMLAIAQLIVVVL